MISVKNLEGFDYTQFDTYAELENMFLSLPSKIKKEVIGQDDSGRNVYGLEVGNPDKPCFFVVSGIHGDHEWRNAHIFSEFLKFLVNPPKSHAQLVQKILNKVHFYVIGYACPYGYENPSYYNGNGVNLNYNFDYMWSTDDENSGDYPFSEKESQIVRDTFWRKRPFWCHDAHIRGFQDIDAFRYSNVDVSMHEGMYADMVTSFVSNTGSQIPINPYYADRGSVRGWAASQTAPDGMPVVSIIYEPGMYIGDREMAKRTLNHLLITSLYASLWTFDKKQKMFNSDIYKRL